MTKIALVGDVMLGRGIDQILQHPGNPTLHECYIRSATGYVRLAERANGTIPRGADLAYVWGEAGAILDRLRADWTIVNLETAITDRGSPDPKGINYRMNPPNAEGLKRLGIDCCVLANNHVLDWGPEGLVQTLDTLDRLQISHAGAGRNTEEARRPAILSGGGARVLVFGFAGPDCGAPQDWQAGPGRLGVNSIERFDRREAEKAASLIGQFKRPDDIVVASIHWGSNWGYGVPAAHIDFAHTLIDGAGADIVHGHSSHHPKGWEIHNGKLILYGCGDFINDYEGISGYKEYRADLVAMYSVDVDAGSGGRLKSLAVAPFRIKGFRLNGATPDESQWLAAVLNRNCRTTGVRLEAAADRLQRLARG